MVPHNVSTLEGLNGMERPTIVDFQGENDWAKLAQQHWSRPTTKARKVRPDIVKNEIWDALEKEAFDFRSLLILENLQILESYLWPGYTDEASNYHVLLITLMVAVKSREGVPVWNIFNDNTECFSLLFRRILVMSADSTLTITIRTFLLSFLISAFQSLDSGIVRKECAPLVSISIWQHLATDSVREAKLAQHGQLRKAWRAAAKRYDAADESVKASLRFERSWLFSITLDFVNCLYKRGETSSDELVYCERYLELLIDLESQLPTRRYVNTLLQDLNFLDLIKLSPTFNIMENGLFRDLFTLLRHYANFAIDDHTGIQYSHTESYEAHCARLARLQRISLKHFKSKLTILALSNYGAIDQRAELENHLTLLNEFELIQLCTALGFRTSYPLATNIIINRELLIEVLLSAHERRNTFQEVVRSLSIVPTEVDLYDPTLLRNETYNGSRSLAIPKLNLQYLTVGDFLWRSFILHRCESFFEVRRNMEDTVKRLQPRGATGSKAVSFDGFSRMGLPIEKPAILEVSPPKVGFDHPAYVRAEVTLDVSNLADYVVREWDSLRPDDVVYLLAVQPQDGPSVGVDGQPIHVNRMFGLLYLRTAEIVQILDENGRSIRAMHDQQTNGYAHRPRLRRLLVNVDAISYLKDEGRKSKGKQDVYESINLIVRRKGRENNFKKILESIQSLILSDVHVPDWLQEVFLGYGDPAGATYTRLPNRLNRVDFRDTFLDWQHLTDSLHGKIIESVGSKKGSIAPPYVLETLPIESVPVIRASKKRRRDDKGPMQNTTEVIKVNTYRPTNKGPYPVDAPKTNHIRFTPSQIDAIISGAQPGLTVIVGPPGTGKTDVATQIINNIYHDFPSERTLLIAHSNQALNQLFQKITKLDIDARHLLRLGHGEEDLDTDANYGKYGRVESFLDNRIAYLAEVDRLAANFGAPGAHGNSCETAGYFNSVYVIPAWSKFWDEVEHNDLSTVELISSFPFTHYFRNAPQPLFPPDASIETLLDIAKGCQHHIESLFSELEDIRPFELLRNAKDKANYLLVKEARIVAMTSTHAAMRRQEIAGLGFHYDNIIMEEAAQITEIENFIPLVLQNPRDGKLPLQRVVLCGDHLQNSPIIQNFAFRHFANLEQSLFLRLVRLGAPLIHLDQQGRARSSIAKLYAWRYKSLGNLPHVVHGEEFQMANSGFRYDYQFIDVPDYKGAGEMQPSPHFIQNLGEAEYAVAIFQYMRLLGYDASKISILATYAGQRALIRDVLEHRCAKNRLFGLPRIVTTVDKYQGEQNDYVILSLTRTSRTGYLRDIRRLTVALSRARLGLYILGRRKVFETCYELKEVFDRLFQRPDKLLLVLNEMHQTDRKLNDIVDVTEMASVEHLGQYVFEMTQAKVAQLKGTPLSFALPTILEANILEATMVDNGIKDEEEEGIKLGELDD